MKIFFCGSIRGGRQDVEFYKAIIRILSRHGTVLTEFIGFEITDSDFSRMFMLLHGNCTYNKRAINSGSIAIISMICRVAIISNFYQILVAHFGL